MCNINNFVYQSLLFFFSSFSLLELQFITSVVIVPSLNFAITFSFSLFVYYSFKQLGNSKKTKKWNSKKFHNFQIQHNPTTKWFKVCVNIKVTIKCVYAKVTYIKMIHSSYIEKSYIKSALKVLIYPGKHLRNTIKRIIRKWCFECPW